MSLLRTTIATLMAALPCITCAADAPPPALGRLGYWSFDQVSANKVFDLGNTSGVNAAQLINPLPANNNWIIGAKPDSGGLLLDNLPNNSNRQNYLQLPTTLEKNAFPVNGTLAFWIKGDFSAQNSRDVFDTYSSTRNHIFIRTSIGGKLQIKLQSSNNTYLSGKTVLANGYTSDSELPIATDVWTHVAISWDTNSGMTYIYKDGKPAISYFWGAGFNGWKPDMQQVRFGGQDNGAVASYDNLALYNRVLSGDEVQALYNGSPAPSADQTPPGAPIALVAEASAASMVVLGWQPAPDNAGLSGYILYRNGAVLTWLPAGATAYGDTGLTTETRYDYQLVAIDQSGNQGPAALVSAVTQPARILFNSTLETATPGVIAGNSIPGWTLQSPPGAVSVTTEHARAGSKAFKFDFKKEDWKLDTVLRAEAIPNPNASLNMALGQTYWTAFSQYLAADMEDEKEKENEEVVWQFHGAQNGPGGISAPLAMYLINGQAVIRILPAAFDKNDQITPLSANPSDYRDAWIAPASALKGRWTDWVIETNFNYRDGLIRVWKDGVNVANHTGSTIYKLSSTPNADGKYQNNENGPYLKFGDYKWGWGKRPSSVNERIVYVDEIRIATSAGSCTDVRPVSGTECGIPIVSSVSMRSDFSNPGVAKAASTVTLLFSIDLPIAAAPAVTIAKRAAIVTNIGGNAWRATMTINANDAEGPVAFNINIPRIDGAATTTISTVTEGLPVIFQK